VISKFKRILFSGYIIAIAVGVIMCANPGAPAGGPADTTPPTLVKSDPPQQTVRFNKEKIRLYFDEFVKLKDIQSQLIISPPMEENPKFRIKGKSVIVELQDELKDSTTYNLYFGDAIVDITEGNPVTNFRYVLSTGDVLDSLSIAGNINNAFDLTPAEGIYLMLYLNNNDSLPFDSLPYSVKPFFVTKSDENGSFIFNNLPQDTFKLFALEDQNSNLLFDQPTERIAFCDSLLSPIFIPPIITDTTAAADSLNTDSVSIPPPDYPVVDLLLFEEYDSLQKFLNAVVVKDHHLIFTFKRPTIFPEIRPLDFSPEPGWIIDEINRERDTITYWLSGSTPDSVTFEVSDDGYIIDTVEIAIVKKSTSKKRKKSIPKPPQLSVKFQRSAPVPDDSLWIFFNYPITQFHLDGSLFIEDVDTLPFPELYLAGKTNNTAKIFHKWKESTVYKILLPDSLFNAINNISHDTLIHQFKTLAIADYGNLFLNVNISEPGKEHIIQLLSGGIPISEHFVSDSTQIIFQYLLPGEVEVKAIYDYNSNGKWDTGDYWYGIQPEKVDYFPRTITIRANWDIEEEWDL